MAELSCQQCRESTAEFALNILTGRELANLQAHLDQCADCRDHVAALATTADRLVDLLPDVEPPPGFAQRVAGTLTPTPEPEPEAPARAEPTPPDGAESARRPAHRLPLAVLVAALVTLVGTGTWLLQSSDEPPPVTRAPIPEAHTSVRNVVYVPLTGDKQRPVGKLYLYPGNPSWVYLQINNRTTPRNEVLDCLATRPDGSSIRLGTITLHNGRGEWGGPTKLKLENLAATN